MLGRLGLALPPPNFKHHQAVEKNADGLGNMDELLVEDECCCHSSVMKHRLVEPEPFCSMLGQIDVT